VLLLMRNDIEVGKVYRWYDERDNRVLSIILGVGEDFEVCFKKSHF